jgi:hypothetical protein
MATNTQAVTLALAGASGRSYTFYVYDAGTEFNPASGVYVVTCAKPNQNGGHTHTILYVGQTGDLSERFDQHHKAASCRQNGANRVCAMIERDEQTRLAIERDLVAAYKPPCNG